MEIRKLSAEEHAVTRELWEQIFTEDTKQFLDYYYFIKTRTNQIYVVEDEKRICSMLQLNPYRIRIEDGEFSSFYIIAVATREECRGRGYMGNLLRTSMEAMYGEKIPFTFLMPAAEAIYTPYDFRFIYRQNTGSIESGGDDGQSEDTEGFTAADAGIWDAGEMAAFFRDHFAGRWQCFAVHDEEYYRTMILEQQSERGGVRILRDREGIAGIFAYAGEEGLEIREPLILERGTAFFRREVRRMEESVGKKAVIYGCEEADASEKKPRIMARIIHLPTLLSAMKTDRDTEMRCSFAVIDPFLHGNSRVFGIYSEVGDEAVHVRETEDSEGVIPVAELTELLFGQKTEEEIAQREGVIFSERLVEELKKLKKLDTVFFNEVV